MKNLKKTLSLFLCLSLLLTFTNVANAYFDDDDCNHKYVVDLETSESLTDTTHKTTYFFSCEYCYDSYTKTETENCTFVDGYTYEESCNTTNKHYIVNVNSCTKCSNTKDVKTLADCTPKYQSYDKYNATHHLRTGYCTKCIDEFSKAEKHTFGWYISYGYRFYGCKKCMFNQTVNGKEIYDQDTIDNTTMKFKKKKLSKKISYYNATKNKIKSVKSSNTKICKVSFSKNKFYYTPLKKGKVKVTVTMQSGAKHITNFKFK